MPNRVSRRLRISVDDVTWQPVTVPDGFSCRRVDGIVLDGAPLLQRLLDTDAASEQPVFGGETVYWTGQPGRGESDFSFLAGETIGYLKRTAVGTSTVILTFNK